MAWPKLNAQREVWLPPRLTVNFLGLVGPQGVLPLVYSEFVMDRVRARDHSALEFLDLFHHRILSLFYQAWEKYRFWVSYERGEADRMSGYLMDMLGLGTPGLENRQEVSDTSLLFYTGLLSMLPRSAMALGTISERLFRCPHHCGTIRRLVVQAESGRHLPICRSGNGGRAVGLWRGGGRRGV